MKCLLLLFFLALMPVSLPSTASGQEPPTLSTRLPRAARRSMLAWGTGMSLIGYGLTGAGAAIANITGEPISSAILISLGVYTSTYLTARMMADAGHAHDGYGHAWATYLGMAAGLTIGAGLFLAGQYLNDTYATSYGGYYAGAVLAGMLVPLGVIAGSYWGFWRSHRNQQLTMATSRRSPRRARVDPLAMRITF